MRRMELFHYEYQHEERQYLQQKEKEEDEKLQRKQRCLTDLIESGFLICETGDDVMKEIKFYRNMNC